VQPPEALNLLMGRGKQFVRPVTPFGLMYLAGYLEKHGHQVRIIDAYLRGYDVSQTKAAILENPPDLVGIGCLTANGPLVYLLIRELKASAPTLPVVLGNVHASVFSSFFISKAGADFVVHGEGEETLLELVEALQKKRKLDFGHIKGLSFRHEGGVVDNSPRRRHVKLDAIPWPARRLVPYQEYASGTYSAIKGGISGMIFSSRGCVNRCTFCSVSQHQTYRLRDPQDVVDELAHIKRKYGVTDLSFGDPLFTAKKKRVLEICGQMANRDLVTPFFAEGHARFIDEEMLEALKAAGCRELAFGIETGSPRIMKQILKNTDHDQVARAVEMTRNAGISATGLFMLGFPGETEEEIRQTIRFAIELPLSRAQFAITTPYPGTPIYNDLVASKEIRLKDEDDPEFVNDWYRYSAYISYTDQEPIWTPKWLSHTKLKRYQKQAVRRFYLRPRQFWRETRKVDFSNPRQLLQLARAVKDSIF
jgi:anaerobic magnesium-protoporphyrin IX monomethyl ester cyclase